MDRIERISLKTYILDSIEKYIIENKLKSGDKLPSQEKMCLLMGVSRSSVREALKILETRDVIEIVNGKGIFLKNNAEIVISAKVQFKREKEDILEIYEVRKMLEREIIKLVIHRATEDELEEVQEVLDRLMSKYTQNVDSNFEDKSFHMKLYRICHNSLLLQLIETSLEAFNRIWKNSLGLDRVCTETIPYHKEMFMYIRQRNVKKAQAVNDEMLDMIIAELLEK